MAKELPMSSEVPEIMAFEEWKQLFGKDRITTAPHSLKHDPNC